MSSLAADLLAEIVRKRHSTREPFDPTHQVAPQDLSRILEAARWAPTAHNMQNFETITVDDPAVLARVAEIRTPPSEAFLTENYGQLSFSEEELLRRGTGVLATMFPPSWRKPFGDPEALAAAEDALVNRSLQGCPTLIVVIYDSRKRAPDSEGTHSVS